MLLGLQTIELTNSLATCIFVRQIFKVQAHVQLMETPIMSNMHQRTKIFLRQKLNVISHAGKTILRVRFADKLKFIREGQENQWQMLLNSKDQTHTHANTKSSLGKRVGPYHSQGVKFVEKHKLTYEGQGNQWEMFLKFKEILIIKSYLY